MWPALRVLPVTEPIKATVRVPGSKSSAARCLIAAALSDGVSIVRGAPYNDDIEALLNGLGALGVAARRERDAVELRGTGGALTARGGAIDIFRSGTALRFLLPLIALATGAPTVITGDPRLQERPIGPLVEALRALGVTCEYLGASGCAPVRVTPRGGLEGGAIEIEGSMSSQFISSLLLAAPAFKNGVALRVRGAAASPSYIELTVKQMARCGIKVNREIVDGTAVYTVPRAPYRAGEYVVLPDASTAAYLWGVGAVTNGEVTIEGIDASSPEPDMQVATALAQMGCALSWGRGFSVSGRGALRPVRIDCSRFPDGALTVAAVAAFARGESVISGLQTLRMKESDRLRGAADLLGAVGISTQVEGDALVVAGGAPHGGSVETHNDHRLAMVGAVIGSAVEGVVIEAPHVVNKSCPEFWQLLRSVGVKTRWVREPLVALIGFMGAGKTTVAGLLREMRGVPVIELDEVILKLSARPSIAAIFELDGEEHFRELEERALRETIESLSAAGGVISTGGGIVERQANVTQLRSETTVVYLKADFSSIEARLGEDLSRPLWRDRERARSLFDVRTARYVDGADLVIDTDRLTAADVARKVNQLWSEGVGE
ncbi:MAG: 3-phosphoshikimate 1-carboxyvinyltransferase 2 [Pseudomonadota bacterium]|jgi:3-phosphoshikimate 1-carboxyvinyltransferase